MLARLRKTVNLRLIAFLLSLCPGDYFWLILFILSSLIMSLVEGLSIFLIIPIIDAISGSGLKQSHFLFTLVLDFIGGATPQQTIINARPQH